MSTPLAGRWVVATRNRGKVAELEELLAATGIALSPLDEFTRDAPTESGLTFVENALIKARHAARASGLAALADDSGLMVDALGGAPGILSARYAGARAGDAENVTQLLEALQGTPDAARGARFRCALVLVRGPDDPAPLIAEGVWRGRIAARPAGCSGFGYDPVFYVPELGATAAELSATAKNAVSHRARAVAELRRLLERDA